MSFFQKSNPIALPPEQKPALGAMSQNSNSQQGTLQAPAQQLYSQSAGSSSVGLGSASASLGNKMSFPLAQSLNSSPFQLNSTTAQPNAFSIGGQVSNNQPVFRGFTTSSSASSLSEKPLFGNSTGGIMGTKGSEIAMQTKVVTRDDFATEAKVILKKQEEALRSHQQVSKDKSTTSESLEGCSLLRILGELTATSERNESVFQALLADAQGHSKATVAMKNLGKSTTNEISHVKSLNESFARKKHSMLCLFDSITSALSLLKKEVKPLFLVFYESRDMNLVREGRESDDVKRAPDSESNIGSLADSNARAARVKKRWGLIEKFESIFIQVYNLIQSVQTNSFHEQVGAQETLMPSSAFSIGTLRRIVEHNFRSLFSIWLKAIGILRRRNIFEKMTGKDFRVVI